MPCKGYSISIGTIYIDCAIGVGGKNRVRMQDLLTALHVLDNPFGIADDFEPHQAIREGLEFAAKAKVVAPDSASSTSDGKSPIDYAMVFLDLVRLVRVKGAHDEPWSMHVGLVVALLAGARNLLGRLIQGPKAFPHPDEVKAKSQNKAQDEDTHIQHKAGPEWEPRHRNSLPSDFHIVGPLAIIHWGWL